MRGPRLAPGSIVSERFEVRQEISHGGSGTIFEVFDRSDGRSKALKLLHDDLVTDPTTRERFLREAQIVRQLRSPHVVQVDDVGLTEEGVPWIAMELIRGVTLADWVREHGAQSPEDALALLEPLAHALEDAHRLGMVHRDIKPENVLVDTSGPRPRTRLLDFGVAKILDPSRTSGRGTSSVGSPLWMSPEQTMAGGRISTATDVWGLALLAWYLLTGKFFWKAAQGSRTGIAGLLRELHVDDIPLASVRAREIGVPFALPRDFDRWFAKAAARDSEARYKSADAALRALRPILAESESSRLGYASTLATSRDELLAAGPGGPSRAGASGEDDALDAPTLEMKRVSPEAVSQQAALGERPSPAPSGSSAVAFTPPPGGSGAYAAVATPSPAVAGWQPPGLEASAPAGASLRPGATPSVLPGPPPVAPPRPPNRWLRLGLLLALGLLLSLCSGSAMWVFLHTRDARSRLEGTGPVLRVYAGAPGPPDFA
jgi:serine/threonine protein kinase